jgi:hypothetical protein
VSNCCHCCTHYPALQDFSDDPRDANRLVYLAADLLAVLLHTLFIWLLPMPLFVIVFGESAVIKCY